MTPAVLDAPASTPDIHWNAVRAGVCTILDLFDNLSWFKGAADWTAWRAFLCATYGLTMSQREYDIFRACTGRKDPPRRKVSEAWVAVGRRGRKSAIGATIAVFEGAFQLHEEYLAPGEIARIPIISKDKDDAQQIKRYAESILEDPGLAHVLSGEPIGETITLTNRCEIRIKAVSRTAGRSRTVPCALYDELAFWPNEEAKITDEEVLEGVRPAMATVPHPIQVGLSSAYGKRGVLWQRFKDFYGVEGDEVLFWKAPTLTMHDTPKIREFVAEEYRKDPTSADAEIGSNFRDDVQTFVTEEVVDAITSRGVARRPYRPQFLYYAFVDPSGGSSDSMTLAIAHWEQLNEEGPPTSILDLLYEKRAPFDPERAVEDISERLREYKVRLVTGDAYADRWVQSAFLRSKVSYAQSELDKNELYLNFLKVMNSRDCRLLDDPQLRAQLVALQRHTRKGGRDIVDHPHGKHDDVANAAVGAILLADKVRPKERVVDVELSLEQEHWKAIHSNIQKRRKELERAERAELVHERRNQERGGDFSIGGGGL